MSGGSREGGWLGVLLCLGWGRSRTVLPHSWGLAWFERPARAKGGSDGPCLSVCPDVVRREEGLKAVGGHIKNGGRLVRLVLQ